jgi:parallel beta-helix repeat protein
MKKGIASVLTVGVLVNGSLFSLLMINSEIEMQVSAATIIVDDDGTPGVDCNYTTIQEAIDAANPGDTVFVKNGIYYENVVMNKSINLAGEDRDSTTIWGSVGSGKDVIQVTADWVNISSLHVTNGGFGGDDAGIDLRDVKRCRIYDNNISSNKQYGISLYNTSENNISNNIAIDNKHGIFLVSSSGNRIMQNNASSNEQYGIYMWLSDNNNVSNNNIFYNNHIGILLIDSMKNRCERNNISYTPFKGLQAQYSDNNTISRNSISNCFTGIEVYGSYNNSIVYNNISHNITGIMIEESNQIIVSNNTIINNHYGVDLTSSTNISLFDNNFIKNGILIYGNFQKEFWTTHNIDTSNTVNGRPIYYLKNQNVGTIPPNAGEIILANCSNIRIENQNLTNSTIGIEFGFSSNNYIANSSLLNNDFAGIYLWFSDNNTIIDNDASYNKISGFYAEYSSGNRMFRNNASNSSEGFILYESNNNYLKNNNITSNSWGVSLSHSKNNHISRNNIFNNDRGIISQYSDANIITQNFFSDNDYGFYIKGSSGNNIYHNLFMNNTAQAYDDSNYGNRWDKGYPIGGNYWSDYSGLDNFKGPYQDIPDRDGIGDTPYIIDADSQDNYPLMEPYTNRTFENYTILKQGWNLISIPLIQENQDLYTVLQMIEGYYDAVQRYNISDPSDLWKHNKIGKSFGNDLHTTTETMSFWIHITNLGDTIFLYNGTSPSSNQIVPLYPGWNMVGYPSLTSHNRTDGLNNLLYGPDVDCIQWYDASTKTWHFMDQDDAFVPGRGYWIHSKVTKTWDVPL